MQVYCRSEQEIAEDFVCKLHTEVCAALNTLIGGRCLYTGKARERLYLLRERAEAAISSGDMESVCPYLNSRPGTLSPHSLLWAFRA